MFFQDTPLGILASDDQIFGTGYWMAHLLIAVCPYIWAIIVEEIIAAIEDDGHDGGGGSDSDTSSGVES